MNDYDLAKSMYLNGKSLRDIEREIGFNRKKLSKLLKADGINVSKGIDDEIYAKACEMYFEGKNIFNISKELNLDRHTLSKRMDKDNIRKQKESNRNNEYDDLIVDYYNNNYSIQKISELLSISTNVVFTALYKNNIITDKIYSKYDINENIFEVIDSEEKAYWLGFLYADGYVDTDRGIDLTLQELDLDHLKKFRDFIGGNIKIQEKNISLNNKSFKAYRVGVSRKKIANDLINLGCFQNKSLILKFPTFEQVPENLIHHFMRGYFDGDGSIRFSQGQLTFSVLGTKEFLDVYDTFLLRLGMKKCKYSMCGKAYELRHGGNIQVKKIFNFIYNNATIYLERKYIKFKLPS